MGAWLEEKNAPARRLYYQAKIKYQELNNITGYSLWGYDETGGRFTFEGTAPRGLPDYIIVGAAPTPRSRPLPAALTPLLADRYQLQASFPAVRAGAGRNRYDKWDAFYLPFAGFHGVERPGPDFKVYRRKNAAP